MFKRLALAVALSACAVFSVMGPVLAEQPWLAEMPSVAKVTANTQGPNAFDTAARQWVAFSSLFDTVMGLIGDRYLQGGMTPAERDLRDAYNTNAGRVLSDLKASLPEGERDFRAGTKFAEWSALRDHYLTDRTFNDTLQAALFSASFRTANAKLLDRYWLSDKGFGPPTGSGAAPASGPAVSRDAATPALGALLPGPTGNMISYVPAVFAFSGLGFALRRRRKGDLADVNAYPLFLPRWLWKHIKAIVFAGALAWFFNPVIGGAVLLLLLALGQSIKSVGTLTHDAERANRDWLSSLGSNHAKRTQALNELFEARTATIAQTWLARWGKQKQYQSILSFKVSRNLASMDNREREYLRIAELLNSAADGKEDLYPRWCAALLWGDGKGMAEEIESRSVGGDALRDSVNKAMAVFQLTTDATINAIQQQMEAIRQSGDASAAYREIAEEFGQKLAPTGGTAWLKPSGVATSPYAKRSEYPLAIGSFSDGTQLSYSGDGSMVTIAPPGSGKTQCNVLPNLLTWKGPAVVLDISGDIYEQTAAWRARNVGPVYKFSPLEPQGSNSYNPLSFVRREPDFLWEDARLLAEMMIVPSLSSDPFWENEARTVLTAAIAHVCYSNSPDERPMHAVLDVLFGGDAWDRMILGLRLAVDVRVMTQHATSLAAMNEKTLSSVLQTARSSLGAWSGERVARVTAKSDWSPLDLRAGTNPTIYIYIRPNEVEAYLSLLRVFIGQHIRMLTGGAVPAPDAPPILFMLDELPRLRNMPPVDEALNIGRKYGLRLWMFAQSVGQLKTAYENAEGMLGSCAVRIYMNPSGADGLAERLSDELGSIDSLTDNSRKRLVEAAELAGPTYRDMQIVIATGAKPARVSKDFAIRSPELKSRMELSAT